MGRAQASMEFLLVMGVIFLMIVPLIIIFLQQSDDMQVKIIGSQANKAALKIRDSADEVYFAGYPTKKTFSIFLPERIESITFFQNHINFTLESGMLDRNIIVESVANITGNMSGYSGVHVIKVQAMPSSALPNQVEITDEPE